MTAVVLPVRDAAPDVRKLSEAAMLLTSILARGDEVPWAVGNFVYVTLEKNAPDKLEEDADRRKRLRAMCKGLSDELDNTIGVNTLVERFDTWCFYDPDLRELYPRLNYSQFREVMRNAKDPNDAAEWLEQVNIHGYKAHQIREAMRGNGTVATKRKNFDVRIGALPGLNNFNIDVPDCNGLKALMSKPGFTCKLTVSWQESRGTGSSISKAVHPGL